MSQESAVLDEPVAAARPRARDAARLLDLEIPVSVSFGERLMSLGELAAVGGGSVIELEQAPDACVELLVNGVAVARGRLMMAGDELALEVTELVSPRERIRSLGPEAVG